MTREELAAQSPELVDALLAEAEAESGAEQGEHGQGGG